MKQTALFKWIKRPYIHYIRNNLPPPLPSNTSVRRLFIDVSVVCKHDAGTGIQRVVRSITAELFNIQPNNIELYTVSANLKSPYHVVAWLTPPTSLESMELLARPGDIFLGLDFSLDTVHRHRKQLLDFRKAGGELWFLMYDLLPLTHPQWFSEKLVTRYKRWLDDLAMLANGFYCISRNVECELRSTLEQRYNISAGIDMQTIPMGCDLVKNHPSKGFTPNFAKLLEQMKQYPFALMVGTLEPRKGHSDVIDAFDKIWSRGENYNLVIAGRPGWKTEKLQTRIRNHPSNNVHLFWLDNSSDETVEELYRHCKGVIVASFAEGFGLPLIEATGYAKPVLARDIAVFREQNTKHANITYFHENITSDKLNLIIITWINNQSAKQTTTTTTTTTWKDSAFHMINRKLS